MDGYGIVNMILMFSYCCFTNIGPCQCVIPWGLYVRPPGLRFSGRDVIPWPLLVGVHGGAPSV